MPRTTVQYCSRCGRAFSPGQPRYLVSVQMVADFDGTLEPGRGPGELSSLLREIDKKSEDELMAEVVQQMSFVLCKPCRDAWMKSPLGEESTGSEARPSHVH